MILDLTNKLIKPIMIIALVSITITWVFGIENMLIREITANGITIKTVDFRLYLENISNAWQTTALSFEEIIPPGTFEEVQGSIIDSSFWNALFNNIAYVIQWIYFPINFILYIIRWLCWLMKILLAIIGWNTMIKTQASTIEATEYYSQLVKILVWITQNLKIPYILE